MPKFKVIATGERTYEITLDADTKLEAIHALTEMLIARKENVSGEIDTISALPVQEDQ